MPEIGKTLIIFGIILIAVGLFLTFFQKIPFLGQLPQKMDFLGKLPGDIYVQRKNFTFYFPLATSIVVSVILSLIFYLWQRK